VFPFWLSFLLPLLPPPPVSRHVALMVPSSPFFVSIIPISPHPPNHSFTNTHACQDHHHTHTKLDELGWSECRTRAPSQVCIFSSIGQQFKPCYLGQMGDLLSFFCCPKHNYYLLPTPRFFPPSRHLLGNGMLSPTQRTSQAC